MIWASLASFFLFSGFAQAQSKNFKQKQAPPAIEEKYAIENADSTGQLSKYFRENNCTEILKYFKDKDLLKLSPIELSIDAYCEPPGKDPDKMFKYAEEKSPDDDTILLLHGRYRWKKYMLSADEIWGKLAARTHDEKMKEMAQQYCCPPLEPDGVCDVLDFHYRLKHNTDVVSGPHRRSTAACPWHSSRTRSGSTSPERCCSGSSSSSAGRCCPS